MMRQFTNQYEKPCATCGVTVPTRAGFIRKDGRPHKRTGLPTWATYCATHSSNPAAEDDRDMSLDEITQKAGHAPGSFPADAPVAGEVRIALRAFARLHGVPGRIANGMMSAGELRAMYNADPVGAFAQSMIEKYREAPTEAPAGEAPQPAPVPVSKPETPAAPVSTTSAGNKRDRLELLKELLSAPELDEERVRQIAREEAGSAPKKVAVTITGIITKELEGAPRHEIFADVLAALGTGEHVYLVGPAGSGKTTLAEQCAEALGLPFMFTGALDTAYALSGFIDAQGRIVSTAFRRAFEHGGLFLFDELDGSFSNPCLWFNAALSNGYAPFPDGMVRRHENFRCIAAANTWGSGADREYVGRFQLDASSLDRFTQIEMNYDENLERLVAGDTPWTRYVQKVRRAVADLKVRKVISPRASVRGNRLLAAGIPQHKVEAFALFGGLDRDTEAKIRAHAR
jgi:cobaltochelatase CobS